MTAPELITPAEYARRRRVTRSTVSRAIERCAIPLVDGKLDPLVADTLWSARTDPAQQERALGRGDKNRHQPPAEGGEARGERATWRDQREEFEAKTAKLNYRKAAGELVVWADVQAAIGRRIDELRVQFQTLPDRAAGELGVDDEHRRKCRTYLRAELARIQSSIANLDGSK